MIRWMFTMLLFITGLPLFSVETSEEFCDLKEWQYDALLYFSYGNMHLLSQEPWQALEQF